MKVLHHFLKLKISLPYNADWVTTHRSWFFPLWHTKEDVAFVSNANWIGLLGHDPASCSYVCLNLGFRGNLSRCTVWALSLPEATTHYFLQLDTNYFSLKGKTFSRQLHIRCKFYSWGFIYEILSGSWLGSQVIVNWHGSITDPLSIK